MYNSWQSCENCADITCFETRLKDHPSLWKLACPDWKPIPCPHCGGPLSEKRKYRYGGGPIGELAKYSGKWYRHCYSCHAEFFVEE